MKKHVRTEVVKLARKLGFVPTDIWQSALNELARLGHENQRIRTDYWKLDERYADLKHARLKITQYVTHGSPSVAFPATTMSPKAANWLRYDETVNVNPVTRTVTIGLRAYTAMSVLHDLDAHAIPEIRDFIRRQLADNIADQIAKDAVFV